jgi:hypothetical protein
MEWTVDDDHTVYPDEEFDRPVDPDSDPCHLSKDELEAIGRMADKVQDYDPD